MRQPTREPTLTRRIISSLTFCSSPASGLEDPYRDTRLTAKTMVAIAAPAGSEPRVSSCHTKREGGLQPPSSVPTPLKVSAIVVVSEIEQIEEIANGRTVLWYVRIVAV